MPSPSASTPIDFNVDDPARLLVECEPEDLFRAVKSLGQWHARALDVTQAALAYWAASAIARTRDREGVGEIRSLIRRLQAIQSIAKQPVELLVAERYQHWNGMVAVLESRAHLLDYHDPAEIQQRTHMQALRDILQSDAAPDGVRTQDLRALLKLSAPRLSAITGARRSRWPDHAPQDGARTDSKSSGYLAADARCRTT